MIEPITGPLMIIDRGIALLTQREKQRQTIFKEIVDPLFKELEAVVQDSLRIFREARDLVANASTSEFTALTLRQRREQMLFARQKLRAMASVYDSSDNNEDLQRFFDGVENCLSPLNYPTDSPIYRLVTTFEAGFKSTDDAIRYLEIALSETEKNWKAVSLAYAKLKNKAFR